MINTVLSIIGLLFVGFIFIGTVCACVLSSQISEVERKEELKNHKNY